MSKSDGYKETSFIMIKPDGVQRGIVGEIISRFEKKGFVLVAMKLQNVSREQAEAHYADLSKKPFFGSLVDYIISGPVCAMVWQGLNVVKTGRVMLGATNPADSAPGTIRGDFSIEIGRNICHGSDAVDAAQAEIALWFPEGLSQWVPAQAPWVYENEFPTPSAPTSAEKLKIKVEVTSCNVKKIDLKAYGVDKPKCQVELTIGDKTVRTNILHGLDPTWEETFEFELDSEDQESFGKFYMGDAKQVQIGDTQPLIPMNPVQGRPTYKALIVPGGKVDLFVTALNFGLDQPAEIDLGGFDDVMGSDSDGSGMGMSDSEEED